MWTSLLELLTVFIFRNRFRLFLPNFLLNSRETRERFTESVKSQEQVVCHHGGERPTRRRPTLQRPTLHRRVPSPVHPPGEAHRAAEDPGNGPPPPRPSVLTSRAAGEHEYII